MTFEKAVKTCHVRSAIYQKSKPEMRYWKNNQKSLLERVLLEDQKAIDWEEYDPRDYDSCSLSSFND